MIKRRDFEGQATFRKQAVIKKSEQILAGAITAVQGIFKCLDSIRHLTAGVLNGKLHCIE